MDYHLSSFNLSVPFLPAKVLTVLQCMLMGYFMLECDR